jgi:precorrin-8X/cobalt-precorrin-8 methylmutase
MPEFDAYLMVDWSASSTPAKGSDSIWYCLVKRTDGKTSIEELENPATRGDAVSQIRYLLRTLTRCERRVLVGFDFPFGYPSGFASALGLNGLPWRCVWDELTRRIVDGNENINNRFAVASDLNRMLGNGPFWGCPESKRTPTLNPTKTYAGALAEKRITDVANMQPVWKLYGNGSVGSQALLGIPTVCGLRDHPLLAPEARVWPFETGLRPLGSRESTEWLILFAEIYPSLVPIQPTAGEVKDAAQIRTIAMHFAVLDEAGQLAPLFEGPPNLTPAERGRVEREEGWTLGVMDRVSTTLRPVALRPAAPLPVAQRAIPSVAVPPRSRGRAGATTEPGYQNRNGQTVLKATGLPGTDHGQSIYVLSCGTCSHEYGANGSDIWLRRCPACQGGRPGLAY